MRSNKAFARTEDADIPFAPKCDEDSSRMHVFCLEHAVEVEQQLRQIGGAHVFLLCQSEYPRIEVEAKLVAEELGIDYLWNKILFGNATKDDEVRIRFALDSEDSIPGNGEWAVKLGINLFYSSNLSRSMLYSKQMPYNCVIYSAFGRNSPTSSPKKLNVYGRGSRKLKKVVAGKWCGKVWMSNQVHPFLTERDPEEQEQENSFHAWATSDENLGRKPENIRKAGIPKVAKKLSRKRKTRAGIAPSKKAKCIEPEGVVSDDSSDVVPFDSLKGNSQQQHRRVPRSQLTKFIEKEDAGSSDSSDDSSLQQLRRILKSKHAKILEREDEVSDDSPDDTSLQQLKKTPRRRQGNFIESEDAVSYDSSEENYSQLNSSSLRSRKKKAPTPRQIKKEAPLVVKQGKRQTTKQVVSQQNKQETPRNHNTKIKQSARQDNSYGEDEVGGPSTRRKQG